MTLGFILAKCFLICQKTKLQSENYEITTETEITKKRSTFTYDEHVFFVRHSLKKNLFTNNHITAIKQFENYLKKID